MVLVKPKADRIPLARSPLSVVICQVQFPPILGIADPAFVASFQESLRSTYPKGGRVGGVELIVGPGGVEAKETQATNWAFATDDGAYTLVLAPGSLTLETRRYEQFEVMRDRFIEAIDLLVASFAPGGRTRLGLRYLNQLTAGNEASIGDWRELVKPELLGIVATDEVFDDDVVMSTLNQTRLAVEESQLLMRSGVLDAGSIVPGAPEIMSEPHFLLDIDHFDIRAFSEFDVALIKTQIDDFHETIHRLFRWSLTDVGLRQLEPQLVHEVVG